MGDRRLLGVRRPRIRLRRIAHLADNGTVVPSRELFGDDVVVHQ